MGKHGKGAVKSTNKKVSLIKHSNKKYSKLLKRSKGNKPSIAKFNKGAVGKYKNPLKSKKRSKFGNFEDESKDGEEAENRKQKNFNSGKNGLQRNGNAKRKFESSNDDEQEGSDNDDVNQFEKKPRRFEEYKTVKRMKSLLPLKDKSGLIQRYMDIEDSDHDDGDSALHENNFTSNDDEVKAANEMKENACSSKKLNVSREKKIASCKLKIASLATAILSEPVLKSGALSELKSMLDDVESPIAFIQQKLVALSLLEIYKDILPGYKIRSLSEQEKDQKMKSDTRQLVDYEMNLLRSYKAYLQKLESMANVLIRSKKARKLVPKNSSLTMDQIMKLGEVGVKCLCDLLMSHPNFNFSHNIIMTVIPFAAYDNETVSVMCCNCLKMVYKQDKLGDISIEGVKQTAKLVKDKSYNVNPKVLETFLFLKIKDVKLEDIVDEKAKKLTHKEKMKTMSRREFKKNKKMEKLENELQETSAEESKKKKMSFQTEIIKQVFLTYFRVLKKSPNCILLGAVLEGLAKFAHLINIEFFDDLIAALHEILERGNLSVRQCLHCIETVFTILSGQGAALNIDPLRFYTHCYKNMLSVNLCSEFVNETPLLITCLDLMINKRKKQVSMARVFAFTHRACTLALQLNHNAAIALLSILKSFVQNFSRLDILLDGDTSLANGAFLPELEDPEHCNAGSTALWGIHLLKKHYHSTVAKLASHISIGCPLNGDGQLPLELARKSPLELFDDYNPDEIADFNPPLSEIQDHRSTRRIKMKQKHWKPVCNKLCQNMTDVYSKVDLNNSFQTT